MHKLLKEINDSFTNRFWYEQRNDMKSFRHFIVSNMILPIWHSDSSLGINVPKFDLQKIEEEIEERKYQISKFYIKCSDVEKLLINDLDFISSNTYDALYPGKPTYYLNEDRSFSIISKEFFRRYSMTYESEMKEIPFNRIFNYETFYICDKPSWKDFKIILFDFFNTRIRKLKKYYKIEKESDHLKNYIQEKFNLIEFCFSNLTPINSKMKLNLKGLNEISILNSNNKSSNIINALIEWKTFLSEIKAETNIEKIDSYLFSSPSHLIINKVLKKYDYLLVFLGPSEESEDADSSEDIIIINSKSSKCRCISPKCDSPKASSSDLNYIQSNYKNIIANEGSYFRFLYWLADEGSCLYGINVKDKLCTTF